MGFYQCHTASFVLLEEKAGGNFPVNSSVYLQQKKKVSIITVVPSAGEQEVNMLGLVMVDGSSV